MTDPGAYLRKEVTKVGRLLESLWYFDLCKRQNFYLHCFVVFCRYSQSPKGKVSDIFLKKKKSFFNACIQWILENAICSLSFIQVLMIRSGRDSNFSIFSLRNTFFVRIFLINGRTTKIQGTLDVDMTNCASYERLNLFNSDLMSTKYAYYVVLFQENTDATYFHFLLL